MRTFWPGLDRVAVDLERVRAVLERVLDGDRLGRQLAQLAHRHEAGVELVGHRGAEDEAARLHADDEVDLLAGVRREHQVDRFLVRGRVLEQGRDVVEEDARASGSRGSRGSARAAPRRTSDGTSIGMRGRAGSGTARPAEVYRRPRARSGRRSARRRPRPRRARGPARRGVAAAAQGDAAERRPRPRPRTRRRGPAPASPARDGGRHERPGHAGPERRPERIGQRQRRRRRALLAGRRLAQDDEGERRVGEAHPEAGDRRRSGPRATAGRSGSRTTMNAARPTTTTASPTRTNRSGGVA